MTAVDSKYSYRWLIYPCQQFLNHQDPSITEQKQLALRFLLWWQGWPSGESTCLPPM